MLSYLLNLSHSQGRKIKCATSQAKYRLFIGNVPRSWGEEDLKRVVTDVGPGVTGLELVKVAKQVVVFGKCCDFCYFVYIISLCFSFDIFDHTWFFFFLHTHSLSFSFWL